MSVYFKPTPATTIRDDSTTGKIDGTSGSDHLIHHRDPGVGGHAGTGMASFAGDDILEASIPNGGQVHMFASSGDDWLILDTTKVSGANGIQGHHAFGGHGQDTFQFTNIENNNAPIVGRLDDFDPTSDRILIDETLGTQYFLAIGNDIFYALYGARDPQNGTSGLHGEERHFLDASALDVLRSAETVGYVNPKNFVPFDFYEHREHDLQLNGNPQGHAVSANTGGKSAAHMFGGKYNPHAQHSSGAQVMRGSDGDAGVNPDLAIGGIGAPQADGVQGKVIHRNVPNHFAYVFTVAIDDAHHAFFCR